MMRMLLCALMLLGAVDAAAQNKTELQTIYKLPVWLDQINRVCPWKSQAGEGYIRVIRTQSGGRHQLYLQWIRKGIAGAATQPVSTVMVKELSGELAVKIEMPTAQLKPTHCQLTARAENILTERRYNINMTLTRPGHYGLQITPLYDGDL